MRSSQQTAACTMVSCNTASYPGRSPSFGILGKDLVDALGIEEAHFTDLDLAILDDVFLAGLRTPLWSVGLLQLMSPSEAHWVMILSLNMRKVFLLNCFYSRKQLIHWGLKSLNVIRYTNASLKLFIKYILKMFNDSILHQSEGEEMQSKGSHSDRIFASHTHLIEDHPMLNNKWSDWK